MGVVMIPFFYSREEQSAEEKDQDGAEEDSGEGDISLKHWRPLSTCPL